MEGLTAKLGELHFLFCCLLNSLLARIQTLKAAVHKEQEVMYSKLRLTISKYALKVKVELVLQDHSDEFDAESEDVIPTSPGTILHYFACLNYVEGVHILLHDERYR